MQKDTSRLIDSNLKIELCEKQSLYFDTYRYGCSFDLVGISCLRGFQHGDLGFAEIEDRFLRRRGALYVQSFMKNLGGNWAPSPKNTPVVSDALANLWDFHARLKNTANIKPMIGFDWGYIYTNDIGVLEMLHGLSYLKNRCYREAIASKPKNVVLLTKHSDYSHRSYLRDRYISREEHAKVANFLSGQKHIRLCPSMIEYFKKVPVGRQCHMKPHWFFDHNDQGELLMLELVMPKMIRKTLPILINN